jgi:hypothetical protein
VALAPVVLVVAIGIQWLAGRIGIPEVALMHTLYLLWAASVACVGTLLVRDLGLAPLARVLGVAIVAGALVSAVAAAIQFLKVPTPGWLVFADAIPSSNLGQRNHAADYIWLGVVSAIGLRLNRRVPAPVLAIVLMSMACGAALTGSRGPIAYGVPLTVLGAWWWLRERSVVAREAVLLSAGSLAGFLAASALLAIATQAGLFRGGDGTWAVDRVTYGALAGDARTTLWRDAMSIFTQAPWLGNGIGNYHWRSFEVTGAGMSPLPAEHAHNLILQWLADYGLPVTLVAIAILAAWLNDALRQRLEPNRWWLLGMLAVIGGHSLLEYPLWYAYFLGPFALLLGAGDSRPIGVSMPNGRPIFALAMALAVFVLGNLWHDDRRIEASVYQSSPASSELTAGLVDVAKASLLSPLARFGVALAMMPDERMAADQAMICEDAIRFRPRPDLVGKCALLAEMNGDRAIAERLRASARRAYPGSLEEIGGAGTPTQP